MTSREMTIKTVKLIDARRISNPATTEHTIIINGLATGQAVEDDESHDEGNAKGDKPAQASGMEHGFFGIAHLISPSGAHYG